MSKISKNNNFSSDGLYLVSDGGNSYHRIAKICELDHIDNKILYASMARDVDALSAYLYTKNCSDISGTMKMNHDGSFTYTFPCKSDAAMGILRFLAASEDKRKEIIEEECRKNTRIDHNANVVDARGHIIHNNYSKEAFAAKLQEYKRMVEEYERILADRLIDDL
jgi:hypothetical protein